MVHDLRFTIHDLRFITACEKGANKFDDFCIIKNDFISNFLKL